MKILHTSDWHLGKKLEAYSRFEEQKLVLDEIIKIADANDVDVVLLAGDIFDTFNPPSEAVELLYSTLKQLTNNGKRPVITIAGNHDSPDRIEAPDVIARINGIILLGYPNSKSECFAIENGFAVIQSDEGFLEIRLSSGELLRIIVSPFANELRLRTYLGDSDKEIEHLLSEKWKMHSQKYCDSNGVNILMSHLLMWGNTHIEEPENEKPIANISARIDTSAIPKEIQYVALGHLHRFQNVGTESRPIIYSGSPVAYSFSEAMQKKYVAIVEAFPNREVFVSKIELKNGKTLIRKTISSIDEGVEWLLSVPNALVELQIECNDYLSQEIITRLKNAHDGIIAIIPLIKSTKSENTIPNKIDLTKSRKDLLIEYYNSKHGINPNNEILSLFEEILSIEDDL